MDSKHPTSFRILSGLPPYGPPVRQFTHGAKQTHTEGLIVEVQAPGTPWFGNFQCGLGSYSGITLHPNGRDLVIVAGGQGYIVRPHDRRLVDTFGGGVKGLWEAADGALIIFNDNGISLSAMGPEGWRWKTRDISSDGFDGLTVYAHRIEGRAWNVVEQQWQPFDVDVATGVVRGGVYSDIDQQLLALDAEMRLRGATPLSPLTKRILEILLGLLALSLVALSVYLTADSIRSGELTWSRFIQNWGLAYFVFFLVSVVLLVGARLIVPRLGPNHRLLSRTEIAVFFALYFAMMLIVLWSSGTVPLAGVAVLLGVAAGLVYRRWGS